MPLSFSRIVAGAILSAALLSCGDDSHVTPDTWPDDFPSRVGDTWTYAVVDSLGGTMDTVEVSITGVERVAFHDRTFDARVWQFLHRDGTTDTLYATASGDTVRVRSKSDPLVSSPTGWQGYLFPLTPGTGWGDITTFYDTTRVVDAGRVTTAAGSFNAYRLIRSGYAFNCIYLMDERFAPGVGMITARYGEYDFCMRNETWELIDYSVGAEDPQRRVGRSGAVGP